MGLYLFYIKIEQNHINTLIIHFYYTRICATLTGRLNSSCPPPVSLSCLDIGYRRSLSTTIQNFGLIA